MTLTTLDNTLWAASLVGNVALVSVLFFCGGRRDFPIFTFFVGFGATRTVLLFLVLRYGTKHGYFLAYWITGCIDYVMQIALILEIAKDALRTTGTWVRDARTSFLSWGVTGLAGAALIATQIGPPQSRGLNHWDVRVTVFTSLLTCVLFIAMSAAANRLGLQQRNRVVAIGQGIAIWAFISLIEELGHVILGWDREFVILVHARMLVYLLVLGYWMYAFWRPEEIRAPLSPEMTAYLVALHRRVQYDLWSGDGRN